MLGKWDNRNPSNKLLLREWAAEEPWLQDAIIRFNKPHNLKKKNIRKCFRLLWSSKVFQDFQFGTKFILLQKKPITILLRASLADQIYCYLFLSLIAKLRNNLPILCKARAVFARISSAFLRLLRIDIRECTSFPSNFIIVKSWYPKPDIII